MRRLHIPLLSIVALITVTGSAAAGHNPARKPGPRSPYFIGDFDTCDFSQWHTQGPNAAFNILRSSTVEGRCAASVTVGPWALGGLVNARSDGAALWLDQARYGTVGHTVWQHFSVRFTAGFRATRGEWNWFAEWHNDNVGLRHEYPNLCWTVRNRKGTSRLAMRVLGGSSLAPTTAWARGPKVRTGHWYDFRVRMRWSPDPKAGLVEWWLDGKRVYSRHRATLYARPDGSVSTVRFLLTNYRLHAAWDATIMFDGVRLGPTRSSVAY